MVENLPSPFDRRVWQEATTLENHGYEVAIVCPTGRGYDERYEYLEGVHIYRYKLPFEADGLLGYVGEYGFALVAQIALTLKVAFRHGFDVIHACNPPDTIFLIGLVAKLFGKRFLYDHHDLCPELYLAKFERPGVIYRLMLLLERLTFWTANVSIATNQSYRKIAIERGRMDPCHVHVVRSGPDLSRVRPVHVVEKLKRGRDFLVGYVGVMGKQEGIDLLIDAIRYIVFDLGRSDVHFGLVGGGTELDALIDYANEQGVSDYVTFTGRVPDLELLQMLSTADVCVNPDRANEMNDKSTMNKIMEYMALEKPIVQFDLTEGRFSAQGASLYAEPNDPRDLAAKILELLADPERRAKMGAIGKQRVEGELSWGHEVPKLLAAYADLFEGLA